MTLKQLPDRFDEATHRELDEAVNKAASRTLSHARSSSFTWDWEYRDLLNHIVGCSKDDLNPKYLANDVAAELLDTHEELKGMLSTAWERKSYRNIRNLAILKRVPEPPPPKSIPWIEDPADLYHRLSKPFQDTFCGAAVEGFYEYLTHNERLFRTTVEDPKYYAKFCSIVQSSGTGKSRLLTELNKKGVVVIYMNLRGKQDKFSFPERDRIPSEILTHFPGTQREYRAVCYAFFTALFDTLGERLYTTNGNRKSKSSVMNWAGRMCDMSDPPTDNTRRSFFQRVSEKYMKVHGDYARALNNSGTSEDSRVSNRDNAADQVADTEVDETTDKLRRLALSDPPYYTTRLLAPYGRVAESLEKILADESDHPKLVIAFDEAHPLTAVHGSQEPYRPADVLCRVVNEYSHDVRGNHAVWVVFASTTSKVADFSPPNQRHNSARVALHGQKLFPPYTQLGWDQSALGLGKIHVENVSQIGHITGYGRPLWRSLRSALQWPASVLSAASSKLCGGYTFDASKMSHVLAVLGQRFDLVVPFGHPDSVEHLENGVASHLRVCLATTMDRNWRFTAYPSEPLLSCVAANDLHAQPKNLEIALKTLLNAVNSGMIDMGQRGELASRLLWLLAKDLFVRTQARDPISKIPSEWDDHLMDCQMISVVDWLEYIFGPRIWDEKDSQAYLARKVFEDAYLNFSHWVRMEADIGGSKNGDAIDLYEWTLRHWQRTSGIQCCHQQPLIDKAIPIYFRGGSEDSPARSRMSQIFISDKARESKSSKGDLNKITRRHGSLSGEGGTRFDRDSESLPYIAILADLGRPSSFSVTFPEREVGDRCLRIRAAGVDTNTYPFLAKYPALMKMLEDLVHLQQMPEAETPYREYLNAQVKFGSTASSEHMEWEHGRTVPALRSCNL